MAGQFVDTARRKPGRAALFAVGLLLVVAGAVGFFSHYNSTKQTAVEITLLVLGAGMVTIACAVDYFRDFEINRSGFKLSTWRLERDLSIEFTTGTRAPQLVDDSEIVPVAAKEDEVVSAYRNLAGWSALRALLTPLDDEDDPLAGCELRLYMYDETFQRLMPILEPEGAEPTTDGWEVGAGATGKAYELGEYVIVTGDDVWNGTYGLSVEQQERCRAEGLKIVASMPVTNTSGDVIAIVSASTTKDESALASDEGFDAQAAVAGGVARVLVDLLRWFPERP